VSLTWSGWSSIISRFGTWSQTMFRFIGGSRRAEEPVLSNQQSALILDKLDQISDQLQHVHAVVHNLGEQLMATIDDLKADVAAQSTVVSSAVALTSALADAVAANTPAAAPAPAPAADPAPAPAADPAPTTDPAAAPQT
jgi:hypothetical protein